MNLMTARFLAASLAGLFITGCNTRSPDLQGPSVSAAYSRAESPQAAGLADPKVNIIFVVDNSGSMADYQAKLADNLELFADKFFEHNRLNYKIGVVPVYDSKYLNDTRVYGTSGVRRMNPLGELVQLIGLPEGAPPNQVFITRETPNKKEVLQKTVKIGVQWGPEAEESFSPVLAIADDTRNREKNQNFYEKDAYLAVIFLTDADDVSPGLSAEDFYEQLIALKNGDRSKILIAAALPNLNNNSSNCKKDGRGPIDSLPKLLQISGGIRADLCSDTFGAQLATFGERLVRVASDQRIPIGFEPDLNTLVVCYGPEGADQEKCGLGPIAEGEQHLQRLARGAAGFYYDPAPGRETIQISRTAALTRIPNGMIFVRAKRIDRNHLDRIQEK